MSGDLWFPVDAASSGMALSLGSYSYFGPVDKLSGTGPHTILTDPDGMMAWDVDDQGQSETFIAQTPVKAGLWKIHFQPPDATPSRTYYGFTFDLAGVPPFFFLSKDKYWK